MGNSSSSLPFSVDQQVGAPHDHNGWALHKGKSTEGSDSGKEVSVFVGKKPLLSKTPVDRRQAHKTQLEPALHHYEYCRKLRHPHILKVYATLDTDNPSAASVSGGTTPQTQQAQAAPSKTVTGDLIVVTEPCIPLSEWLLGAAASGPPTPEQLAWGLECVIEGLSFLHASAKLAHGGISPQSLYVTPSGDVKLWNFSLVTPVGPNTNGSAGGPDGHFLQWEAVCCPESYRSPERVEQKWDAVSNTGGVHAMDSYSLGVLISDYWYRNPSTNANNVPQTLQKALQRLTTSNIKMRPRLQPLLRCPAFDTSYRNLQRSLDEISIQPVEQKIQLWQNLGLQLQQQNGVIPKDVALYKILPLIITTVRATCGNESMLSQDMYRREGTLRQRFALFTEFCLSFSFCGENYFFLVVASLYPLYMFTVMGCQIIPNINISASPIPANFSFSLYTPLPFPPYKIFSNKIKQFCVVVGSFSATLLSTIFFHTNTHTHTHTHTHTQKQYDG
ncbi:MAG: SCY1-like protein 1 [Bacillariaceae sp.]|jgi:SCY1-like protein 1